MGNKKKYIFLAIVILILAVVVWLKWGLNKVNDFDFSNATATTKAANNAFVKSLNLEEQQDFEDARRGLIAVPSGKILARDGSTVWDFDRFRFVEGNAPTTVNPSLWRHAKLDKVIGLFKVTDGIYQLRGFDISNLTLIEGKTGWIVVDTLSCRETAQAAMEFARKHLGNKPVSAIIFSHSHIDHFGGVLGVISAEESKRRKLPIVAPQGFMEEATSENVLVGIAMGRRATWQFGNQLPSSAKGLVDSGIGNTVALGEMGILPPNILVSHTPQEMTIDGVHFIFQNVPSSEAPAEMAFYLPDFKAYCGAEIMSQTMHQILTLRGAKVRNALSWAGYIEEALERFSQAEVYFGVHTWPVFGNARVIDFMKKQRDAYKYIHDQTVGMINSGMKPDEIADKLKLPKSLEETFAVRGYYGSWRRNARAVYQHYLGWFDGNPANMDPLPRQDAAKRYMEMMGGADSVVKEAQKSFDRGEYRWVAEILNHVVFAQPRNKKARELLARTYDQLGYVAESAIERNLYLTGALELRSGENGIGVDRTKGIDLMTSTPVENYLIVMAASLDGLAAEGKELKINLVFSDIKESYVLWIENCVLHHRKAVPERDANATLTLTKGVFLTMMLGKADVKDILSDKVKVRGSKIDLIRFFTLFKRPPKTFTIVTP
ncbi:MAG: alkyl sulfatase dimerization domain-containing protein [Smithella sp.]|jgi:alkyl sulfatase BDS1-like metallo-beta-lactamase superfamily hydrolase